MKKFPLILFIFTTLFLSCTQNGKYIITGNLQHSTDSLIFVLKEGTEKIDSIFCKKGQFQIKGDSDSTIYLSMYIPDTGIWLDVWVKNKDQLTISGDVRFPDLIQVQGNSINDKLSKFKSSNRALLEEKDNYILQQVKSVKDTLVGSANETNYLARISNIEHQLKEKALEFIQSNPDEPASVVLLRDYLVEGNDANKIQNYLSLVTSPATETLIYKQLDILYHKIKQTSIGSYAPDFSIVDINNDTVSLSDFKGEYLLLTFAASWCDICRKDNKELVEVYKKFHSKGLQMFTVSFDESKSDWGKAAKEDKITWSQAIDTQGWGAEMLDRYNITTIPANFLINKTGLIIDKDLYGEELKRVLNEKLK